jgi:hypothetical protein
MKLLQFGPALLGKGDISLMWIASRMGDDSSEEERNWRGRPLALPFMPSTAEIGFPRSPFR